MKILLKPLVTEKVSNLNEIGIYGFIVNNKANKIEIKKEIEKVYNVNVESVHTMRHKGKARKRSTKHKIITGRTPAYKKAIVQVAEGEIIDFYSGI